GVLGEELEQLELLVGEVERTTLELGGVGVRVDGQLAGLDQPAGAAGAGLGEPADGDPQPGLDLGRAGDGEDHVVDAPVGVHRDQAGLGEHGEQRHAEAGRAEHPAGGAGVGELGAGVHQDDVGAGAGDEHADVARRGTHRVGQEVECAEHRLARGRRSQQQDLHTSPPSCRGGRGPGVSGVTDGRGRTRIPDDLRSPAWQGSGTIGAVPASPPPDDAARERGPGRHSRHAAPVLGQLARPAGRVRVTESLGSSLVVTVGVVALATLAVLTRHPAGTQALIACLAAAGLAVTVARLADMVFPYPRLAPQVPRGGLGVVLGAMAGAGAAAVAGGLLEGVTPQRTAVAGLCTAIVAVVIDLSVGYAEAGRRLDGDAPALWLARHMQGPLGAFALSAPAAY